MQRDLPSTSLGIEIRAEVHISDNPSKVIHGVWEATCNWCTCTTQPLETACRLHAGGVDFPEVGHLLIAVEVSTYSCAPYHGGESLGFNVAFRRHSGVRGTVLCQV